MAYGATVVRLLISCPGDILAEDLAAIHHSITRWNVLLGEQYGLVFIPVSWSSHAAAEFGDPPQDIINRQLVDRVDACLAILWGRLGTPTDAAASGTVEEINRINEAGKPVSVLRCTRDLPVDGDHAERARLDEYLKLIYSHSLIVRYVDVGGLSSQVDTILVHMAQSRDWATTPVSGLSYSATAPADVWPMIDRELQQETDTQGRIRTRANTFLLLENRGDSIARNVTFEFRGAGDEDSLPVVIAERSDPMVPLLAPRTSVRYPLSLTMGTLSQFECSVRWETDSGEGSNTATLRP